MISFTVQGRKVKRNFDSKLASLLLVAGLNISGLRDSTVVTGCSIHNRHVLEW